MPTARMMLEDRSDEGTLYQVMAHPREGGPFVGPPDRDWNDFRIDEDGDGYFEWRMPSEFVEVVAERLREGEISIEEALADQRVKTWLVRVGDEAWQLAEDDQVNLSKMTEREAGAWVVLECSYLTGYMEDDDRPLADAAECLDLPDWAEVEYWCGGGPGSGYDAAGVRLAKGKSLRDLEAWFKELERAESDSA